MKRQLNQEKLRQFEDYLVCEERSNATIEKYLHDMRTFYEFVGNREVVKSIVLDYKNALISSHAVTSANSMLAAINVFFRFCGWYDLCVKQYKIQKSAFCPEEKELTKAEYMRLVQAAKRNSNERLNLIIQTICGTGIRVSELQYITVEAVHKSEAFVNCKGKNRRIFIVAELRKKIIAIYKKAKYKIGCGIRDEKRKTRKST